MQAKTHPQKRSAEAAKMNHNAVDKASNEEDEEASFANSIVSWDLQHTFQ
jgi:hypothetical protein